MTPQNRILHDELFVFQLSKKFAAFNIIQIEVNSFPYFTHFLRSAVILSICVHFSLPNRLFPSGAVTSILYAFLMYALSLLFLENIYEALVFRGFKLNLGLFGFPEF
jgi:hypothetical protein